jgi:hypothetical protein
MTTDNVDSYETSFPALAAPTSAAANVLVPRKKPPKKDQPTSLAHSAASAWNKPKRRIRPAQATVSVGNGNIASLSSEEPLQTVPALVTNRSTHDSPFLKRTSLAARSDEPSSIDASIRSKELDGCRAKMGKPQPEGISSDGAEESNSESTRSQLVLPAQEGSDAAPPIQQALTPVKAAITAFTGTSDKQTYFRNTENIKGPVPDTRVDTNFDNAWSSSSLRTPTKNSLDNNQRDGKESPMMDAILVENLSTLYTTLIRFHLVPSTPMELHLLIGLLTIKDSASRQPQVTSMYNILVSPEACREFAKHSLMQLRSLLGNLPLQVLSALVECPPFREQMGGLAKELASKLKERQGAIMEANTGFGGNHCTVHLALPFDETQDSRHNFKSRDELALYKNREESRDAFLYQLRYFQNVRGRVLDTAELESSMVRLQQAARKVIEGVDGVNMHWFAKFFCTMLLQIGLVPMEETDKDLLNIADKDKLQKLHKRFSSKVGTSKGRSTKILSETNDTQSPEKEAFRYFPGHQEFFLIFLLPATPYNFGVHLKSRLVTGIGQLSAPYELKGMQDRIQKLQLLARFLGVLVFSPTWHKPEVFGILNSSASDERAIWTGAADPILPLLSLFHSDSDNEIQLLSTVSWILDFLRMGKWDSVSMRDNKMEAVIAKLLSIQSQLSQDVSSGLQLLQLSLESFFHEVIGLRRAHLLSRVWPLHTGCEAKDVIELKFAKNFIFASVSHLDELFALLNSLSLSTSKVIGTPRKLRPSIVSLSANLSSLTMESSSDVEYAAPGSSLRAPIRPFDRDEGRHRIVGRLVDIFFHQHGDLKNTSEFIVDRALEKAILELKAQLPSILKKVDVSSTALSDATLGSSPLGKDVMSESMKRVDASLRLTIRLAIEALSPPSKAKKVKEIAGTLALEHAILAGKPRVQALVDSEVRKHKKAKEKSAAKIM